MRLQCTRTGLSGVGGDSLGWNCGFVRVYRCLPFVNLKNEIASYFTSKVSLFRNSRGIVIQDMQTMVNHRLARRTMGRGPGIEERRMLGGAILNER